MIIEHLQRMARYNRWMNTNLYDICATMSDEERKAPRGAPFGSIHGVLNHILLADRVWLGRVTGEPFHATALDQELCSEFNELRREREITDDAIEAWVATLDETQLASTLTFTTFTNPTEYSIPLWIVVQHFFNHQTHHRGQLTALIEIAGYDCGVTDILRLPES